MTTPAPAPVLSVSADKAEYEPGDPLSLTLHMTTPVPLTITASGTLPDGTTVSGQAEVVVRVPVKDEVQFGLSDSFADAYVVQSSTGGHAVVSTTVGSAPAA